MASYSMPLRVNVTPFFISTVYSIMTDSTFPALDVAGIKVVIVTPGLAAKLLFEPCVKPVPTDKAVDLIWSLRVDVTAA